MQVEELLKPFPIKEFHAFPKALMGPGAHELIGPEAIKLGFTKPLIMTSGLRGTDIVHKIFEARHRDNGWRGDARALLLLNATPDMHEYQLPPLEKGAWRRIADTAREDAIRSDRPGTTYKLQPRSVAVIVNAPERVS